MTLIQFYSKTPWIIADVLLPDLIPKEKIKEKNGCITDKEICWS